MVWSLSQPVLQEGHEFCVHCTGKVAEPHCNLLKVTALGAWALNQEPSCPILLYHLAPIVVSQVQLPIP